MNPTRLNFATHSLVPLLQPFLAPAAPGAIAPSATYALIHRLTTFNEVDEVEVMRNDQGKVVGKRFWPKGTRKVVEEIEEDLPPVLMGGDVGAMTESIEGMVQGVRLTPRKKKVESATTAKESEESMRKAAKKTLGSHERWRTSAEEYEPDEDAYIPTPTPFKVAKDAGKKPLATKTKPAPRPFVRKTTSSATKSSTKALLSTKLTPEELALQQAALARQSTCQVDVPLPSDTLTFPLTKNDLSHATPIPTMRLTDDGSAFQIDQTPEESPSYAPRDPRSCPPLPPPSPSSTLPPTPSFPPLARNARGRIAASASFVSSASVPDLPMLVAKLKGSMRTRSSEASVVKELEEFEAWEKAQKRKELGEAREGVLEDQYAVPKKEGWKKRVGTGKGRNRDNEDM